MSVCLYNNRQIGRRMKDGMHTNLLSCINMELWFGGRASAELRAWRLGRCRLGAPRVWRVSRDANEHRMRRRQSQLSHAYGSEYLCTPSLGPVVRRKTDHLAWARMGTDGCRGQRVHDHNLRSLNFVKQYRSGMLMRWRSDPVGSNLRERKLESKRRLERKS